MRKIITLKWEATYLLVTHEKSFRRPPSDLTCSLGHSHFPASITDSRLSKGCGFSFFGTRFFQFSFSYKFWKSLLVTALQCNALQTQARRGRKVAKAVNASQLICNKAVSESYYNLGSFLGQLFDEASKTKINSHIHQSIYNNSRKLNIWISRDYIWQPTPSATNHLKLYKLC